MTDCNLTYTIKPNNQGLLVSRQGSSVAPTPNPHCHWHCGPICGIQISKVSWFRYPSCSKHFINDLSEGEMPVAGGKTIVPSGSSSAQPISTPASATIHDRTCFLITSRTEGYIFFQLINYIQFFAHRKFRIINDLMFKGRQSLRRWKKDHVWWLSDSDGSVVPCLFKIPTLTANLNLFAQADNN